MLVSSTSPNLDRQFDDREATRSARRELGSLVGAALALFVTSLVLDQSTLARRGPWDRADSWAAGPPGLTALRVLRVVLHFGSAALLLWLVMLAALCVPRRSASWSAAARLPFGMIVRRALIGTVVLAVAGPSGNAAVAASRPAVVANDATGGQRWPDLPPHPQASAVTTTTNLPPGTAAPTPRATRPPSPPTTGPTGSTPAPETRVVLPPLTSTPAAPALARPPTESTARTTAGPKIIEASSADVGPPVRSFSLVAGVASSPAVRGERTVLAGESFWSIAEDAVLSTVDEATESDVARYWDRLVEHNRARLPDPANPDLLWVGTVLDLPDPTSDSTR